jgi:hypothetical protein
MSVPCCVGLLYLAVVWCGCTSYLMCCAVLCRDAERAEAAAKEEEDRHLQKVDPKSSLAWKRGGESRVSLHVMRSSLRGACAGG